MELSNPKSGGIPGGKAILLPKLPRKLSMIGVDGTTVFSLAPNASFQKLAEGAAILMIDSGQFK